MISDDDWHNMNPRDGFKMESYERMIEEEKTSRSTSSLSVFLFSLMLIFILIFTLTSTTLHHIGALGLANPRHQPAGLGPLEINS